MYNRDTIVASIASKNPGAGPVELAGLFWDEVFAWWEAATEDSYSARSMDDEEWEAAQPLRDWEKFMAEELGEARYALQLAEDAAAEAAAEAKAKAEEDAAAEAEAEMLRCEGGGSRSRRHG